MSQITLYLDDELQALLAERAKAQGLSKSRWVAKLIREHTATEWPPECLALAGRFGDFPLREEMAALPADTPRVGF